MARKTKLMQRVEKEHQRPLEKLLPEMVNEKGLSSTAEELGVSKATLGYWLLKLGISVRRVALAPGRNPGGKAGKLVTFRPGISPELDGPKYAQVVDVKRRLYRSKPVEESRPNDSFRRLSRGLDVGLPVVEYF